MGSGDFGGHTAPSATSGRALLVRYGCPGSLMTSAQLVRDSKGLPVEMAVVMASTPWACSIMHVGNTPVVRRRLIFGRRFFPAGLTRPQVVGSSRGVVHV